MRMACGSVMCVLLLVASCAAPPAPGGDEGAKGGQGAPGKADGPAPTARAASSDACDLPPLGTSMFACLLPSSDPRHDPSARVSPSVDCYWQVKAPIDKELRAEATGALLSYGFHVENQCVDTDVEVELHSPTGTLSNWYCPFDLLTIPRGSSNNFSCYVAYAKGETTRSRAYTLRVVTVNGRPVAPVDLDPEVVLERSGESFAIPPLKARENP
jgi:hypothetical protein